MKDALILKADVDDKQVHNFLNGIMEMVFESDFDGNCERCNQYGIVHRTKESGKMLCKKCMTLLNETPI